MSVPPGRNTKKCNYPFCTNKYYIQITDPHYKNKLFFRIPRDKTRRELWYNKVRIPGLFSPTKDLPTSSHICEDHFDDWCWNSTLKTAITQGAIPRGAYDPVGGECPLELPHSSAPPQPTLPLSTPPQPTLPLSTPPKSTLPQSIPPQSTPPPSTPPPPTTLSLHTTPRVLPPLSPPHLLQQLTSTPKRPGRMVNRTENTRLSTRQTRRHGLIRRCLIQKVRKARKPKYELCHILGGSRLSDLSPRRASAVKHHNQQQARIGRLERSLASTRISIEEKLDALQRCHFTGTPPLYSDKTVKILQSQSDNLYKLRPSWNIDEKVFALAAYKRGPRCYRFIRQYLPLPSQSTIKRLLHGIPFDSGINPRLMRSLKTRVDSMHDLDKYVVLMFDEMSISENMYYDVHTDQVYGYVDLGSQLGRTFQVANHALVFMVKGIRKSWKQPVAYYFTRDQIKTAPLQVLVKEVVTAMQQAGLTVIATVCDMGTTNTKAMDNLREGYIPDGMIAGPYFSLGGQVITTLYDVPHILKNIRTALYNYDIRFQGDRVARWSDITDVYTQDVANNSFTHMYHIKPQYLTLPSNYLKMRVMVAAKTLSYKTAMAIASYVMSGRVEARAIDTSDFVKFVDAVFDSLNSSVKGAGMRSKPCRGAVAKDTPHVDFWYEAAKSVSNWVFLRKSTGTAVSPPPSRDGLVLTLKGMLFLWPKCRKAGFEFLRTRSLTQDPLENLFGVIRQCGVTNTNPTPYQFVAALKSAILNGLVTPARLRGNCERDEGDALQNLHDFVKQVPLSLTEDVVNNTTNSVGGNVSGNSTNNITDDIVDDIISDADKTWKDSPAIPECLINWEQFGNAHVAGYLLSKLNLTCAACRSLLHADNLVEVHYYVQLREYDDEIPRLQYASIPFIKYLSYVYEVCNCILKSCGHKQYLKWNCKKIVKEQISFKLNCEKHVELEDEVLDTSIVLIIRKFYEDKRRQFVHCKSAASSKKKIKIHKHL